jgi:3-isopropylmalate dehydratase small subunit
VKPSNENIKIYLISNAKAIISGILVYLLDKCSLKSGFEKVAGAKVTINHLTDEVKNSPEYDSSQPIDDSYQHTLNDYYKKIK